MTYYNAASEELVQGWSEIARAAGMANVPEKKVRAIAARDGWPVYRQGYVYIACPKDLIDHIRKLAKERAADRVPSDDPVRALLGQTA